MVNKFTHVNLKIFCVVTTKFYARPLLDILPSKLITTGALINITK